MPTEDIEPIVGANDRQSGFPLDDAESSPSGANPEADLSLPEMLRVLDVARQLREDRQTAQQTLQRDELRTELRRKLKQSAEVSGDTVSDAEIDAAIDQYFDNMHVFHAPPPGFSTFLAHVYVLRRRVAVGVAAVALSVATLWFLFGSPWAPLSPSRRAANRAVAMVTQAESLQQQIDAISVDSQANNQAKRMVELVRASSNTDASQASATNEELAQMLAVLKSQFEVHIVGSANERSAFERTHNQRGAGFYVIVEARDEHGNVLPQSIRNVETGQSQTVKRWAQRVPEDVYKRLQRDKLDDGVLNETLFATKPRGRLAPEFNLLGSDGRPITQSAQITQW